MTESGILLRQKRGGFMVPTVFPVGVSHSGKFEENAGGYLKFTRDSAFIYGLNQ